MDYSLCFLMYSLYSSKCADWMFCSKKIKLIIITLLAAIFLDNFWYNSKVVRVFFCLRTQFLIKSMLCGAVGGILNWLSQYFCYQFTFGFDEVLTFRYSFSEASSIKPNKISWTFSNSPTCSTCFSEAHYKTGNTI